MVPFAYAAFSIEVLNPPAITLACGAPPISRTYCVAIRPTPSGSVAPASITASPSSVTWRAMSMASGGSDRYSTARIFSTSRCVSVAALMREAAHPGDAAFRHHEGDALAEAFEQLQLGIGQLAAHLLHLFLGRDFSFGAGHDQHRLPYFGQAREQIARLEPFVLGDGNVRRRLVEFRDRPFDPARRHFVGLNTISQSLARPKADAVFLPFFGDEQIVCRLEQAKRRIAQSERSHPLRMRQRDRHADDAAGSFRRPVHALDAERIQQPAGAADHLAARIRSA